MHFVCLANALLLKHIEKQELKKLNPKIHLNKNIN